MWFGDSGGDGVVLTVLIVLEDVRVGVGGSDGQEVRWWCLACGDCGGT